MIRDIALSSGKPFVVWLYGSDVFRAHGEYLANLQELFKSGAVFCCTSRALRQEAALLGCSDEKLHVFYPGIDVPDVVSSECRPPHEVSRVVSVGRLVDFKDPASLVAIAKLLQEAGVRFLWDHYGDGPLRDVVKRKIDACGLGGVFFLHGEQHQARVKLALQEADLMIHPAVVAPDGGRESLGVALIEALAAGLPIVSNRVGGISEVVEDGKTGFLTESGDIEGMAAKAIRLIREPGLRRIMADSSYQKAKETFEATKQVAKLDAFYDQLLSSGRAADVRLG
jgi:glycosyltransferase involved in cell wall biosynthesis